MSGPFARHRGGALSADEGRRVAVRRRTWSPTSRTRRICCWTQVKGELYIGFAEVDPSVPGERHSRAEGRAGEDAGTKHVLETIPGTHHGYCFAARNDYNPVAAEETLGQAVRSVGPQSQVTPRLTTCS